jgi:hypothetical protein
MKRREFVTLLAGVAAWPLPAYAKNEPAASPAAPDHVGQVATVQGGATVSRADETAAAALNVKDVILQHDTLETAADGALGVTFDDATTFSLSANTRIVVEKYIYQKGGKGNAALFRVAQGTTAFVANLVARNGDMKVTTPTATIGIRGTTGVVEVPTEGAAAGQPTIKLYADADGHVGRIEVFDLQGSSLGTLSRGASAFTIRTDASGRLTAVPYQIPREEIIRDRGVLQRLVSTHNIGRGLLIQRQQLQHNNLQHNNLKLPNNNVSPTKTNLKTLKTNVQPSTKLPMRTLPGAPKIRVPKVNEPNIK